ncbi:MAG TPA: hypothetical protein PK982_05210 [Anaerolineaceae bacterium]|nr:hypothetical protein [Anaerolineaceae bacterium]
MKKAIPILIAGLSGLLVLAALIWQPQLAGWLEVVLNWAVIIASVAALVALATLLLAHTRKIIKVRHGFIYSLILIGAFLASFVGGMTAGVENPSYLRWISAIQQPAEASLLGLAALVMAAAALRLFHQRGWSALTVSFGISALVFLVLGLGWLQALQIPQLDIVIGYLEALPLVGMRGLLIGMGLGALLLGLRIVLGLERPYGE